jgi:hypothetical protein
MLKIQEYNCHPCGTFVKQQHERPRRKSPATFGKQEGTNLDLQTDSRAEDWEATYDSRVLYPALEN